MSTRPPPDFQLIRRMIEEIERCGGTAELARQLSLNKNLEERNQELHEANNSLTRTKLDLLERIQDFQKQETDANQRRDDAIEQSKVLDKEVSSTKKELEEIQTSLAQRLKTKNEWESVTHGMEEERARLNGVISSSKTMLAPALWVRSILEVNRPLLFDLEKEYVLDFLTKKQPVQPYTDEIGHRIIDLLIDELRRRGTLVPRLTCDLANALARQWADKTGDIDRAVRQFLNNPAGMSNEQRRALLIGLVAAGVNSKEKFDELQSQAAEIGAHCPFHNIKLAWNPRDCKWKCTVLGCNFTI